MGAAPATSLPAEAAEPCSLPLSPYISIEDLELVNRARGRAVLDCDSKRALAVSAFQRQLAVLAEQARIRAERRRPWWRVWP